IFERFLIPLAEGHVLRVEAALQQEIRERLQQIVGVDSEIFAGVARVLDLHRKSRERQLYCLRYGCFCPSSLPCDSRFFSSAANPRSSVRLMRRCAYSPSRTNSAAEAFSGSGSLAVTPTALILSSRP